MVSPSLFPLLGVEPIKGRTFAREEQGEGHDDVIVISERLWKRRFNSDPMLVGKNAAPERSQLHRDRDHAGEI